MKNSMENNDVRGLISRAVNRLQDVDYHIGAESRKVTLDVITELRNAKVPDDDIETLVGHVTGLRPNRVKEYMRHEESASDKFAQLVSKYGLPERRRYVPILPDKGDKQQ